MGFRGSFLNSSPVSHQFPRPQLTFAKRGNTLFIIKFAMELTPYMMTRPASPVSTSHIPRSSSSSANAYNPISQFGEGNRAYRQRRMGPLAVLLNSSSVQFFQPRIHSMQNQLTYRQARGTSFLTSSSWIVCIEVDTEVRNGVEAVWMVLPLRS